MLPSIMDCILTLFPNSHAGACISYFYHGCYKNHNQKQLMEERAYFDLWFQSDKSSSWWAGLGEALQKVADITVGMTDSRHGGRSRELNHHI